MLKYVPKTMAASVVLAMGYDEVAQRIKKRAAEHGSSQVKNIALARAKKIAVGKPVPAQLYQGVAEVRNYVYPLRKAG